MTSGVKDTTDIDRYQPLISMTLSDHLANIVIIFCSAWGKVTHFVSWCWAYSLNDVVSAIERWVQKSNEDARNVFLWMCFFCNNQYRIKEEAPKSSRGSCYNMWQLQSRSSLLFRLVTTVLPMGKEQRVDYASHVRWMHHRDPVFWCFLIVELCVCVMSHDRFVVA